MISPVTKLEDTSTSTCKVNISNLVGNKQEVYKPDVKDEETTTKKSKSRKSTTVNMTKKDNNSYYDKYSKTNALLDQTIYEIDDLNAAVKNELKLVTASKTLKKKYEYISELAGTSGSLLSTKVTAIRELNKSITDSVNLEIKMAKENKQAEETDDKRIMDMYNAFINTPIGTYTAPTAPSNIEMTLGNGGIPITPATPTGDVQTDDLGYNQYMNNLTPEQRKIQLEKENIKTVVVFDPETGQRYFDNFNLDTNQPVSGLPLPEAQFLDSLNINMRTGVARDTNLNLTYPIVVKSSAPNFSGF